MCLTDKVLEHRGNKPNERSVHLYGKPDEAYRHHQILSAVVRFFECQHRQAGEEERKEISDVYNSLADEEKAWVLDYLSAGKGVIPYEKTKTYNPRVIFLLKPSSTARSGMK